MKALRKLSVHTLVLRLCCVRTPLVFRRQADARAAETASGHFKASADGHKIELMLGKAMDSIDKVGPTTTYLVAPENVCCSCLDLRT